MKKILLLSILGLGLAAASAYGQGYISLDTYNYLPFPHVTYGAGVPIDGISGASAPVGQRLLQGWTAGIYFVAGTPDITDPAGNGMPDPQLALGTGQGSSAVFAGSLVGFVSGLFLSISDFNVSASGTPTVTVEIVAYDSAASSYATALYRGHSDPFTMPSATMGSAYIPGVGSYMTGFSVTPVPEPTTLVLGVLGSLSLLLLRAKKSQIKP